MDAEQLHGADPTVWLLECAALVLVMQARWFTDRWRSFRASPAAEPATFEPSARRAGQVLLQILGRAQNRFIAATSPQVLFDELLSELLPLTESEYGFIGEVLFTPEGEPYLKTHAITNIAWNEETRAFYETNAAQGLEFHNLHTLFGAVLTTAAPVIANDAARDPRRGGVPDGHPSLNAFLGLPVHRGDVLVGMLGLANRPGGYDQTLVEFLRPILDMCAHIIEAWRTDQRRQGAEAALRAARDQAVEATRLRSEFLANMSHELRTPMNGILAMTDLTLGTTLTPEQREYLGMVQSSARHLLHLLNDVLDFARIEAGGIQLESVSFSLRSSIEDIVNPLRVRAQQGGLVLRAAVAPEVPDDVVGDPARLRQVLLNLVDNAIKFTQQGQVEVRTTLESRSETEVRIRITVADTGIGIPSDKQRLVFEPFRQADDSTTRLYGGSGLGLAISAQLIERMGGAIWLESVPGVGSTFRLTLPLLLRRARGAESMAPAPRAAVGTAADGAGDRHPPVVAARPLRILVAEDHPVNRLATVRLLERAGHAVTATATGREAVEAVEQSAFDLVLMDVQMPEMDGLAATRLIRERERVRGGHVPIVALTAHAIRVERDRCLAAGMDDYLSKPIDGEVLVATAARVGRRDDHAAAPAHTTAVVLERDWLFTSADNDAALVTDLIGLFRADLPAVMRDIRAALGAGATEDIARAAHRLKGALATLGARAAFQAAGRLEGAGRDGDLRLATTAAGELERELARLEPEFDALDTEPGRLR